MARDRVPVLKRCRSLNLDPIYLGIDKKSKKTELESKQKNERIRSADERKAESEIHLRRTGKTVP